MIEVTVSESGESGESGEHGAISRISVSGHAGYAARGKDIVCSAASVLAYTAAGALEELAGLVGCYEEHDGRFDVSAPKSLDGERRRVADTVLRTALIGYRMIESEYPKHLRVISK